MNRTSLQIVVGGRNTAQAKKAKASQRRAHEKAD
jgi:hypothetical protein